MVVKNPARRTFLKWLVALLGSLGIAVGILPFVSYMRPSRKAIDASKPVTVNLAGLEFNQLKTVMWRGLPIFIVRRSDNQLEELTHDTQQLRDPNSEISEQPMGADNIYRSLRKDIFVVVGVCTHLGCSPTFKPKKASVGAKWEGGFFCACHGSKFDMSGRVFKGVPAPTNLLVPPYFFQDENTLVIGELSEGENG